MRRATRVRALGLSAVIALATVPARDGLRAQPPALPPVQAALSGADLVRATYTKYEYMVPTRDGARLFTAVYVPKDASQKYPFLITRTPYSVSPYGVDQYPGALGPSEHFQKDGFIFVYQDARGRYMSEGGFQKSHRAGLPLRRAGFIDHDDGRGPLTW